MTDEFMRGVLTGAGWGLFIGGLLGVVFAFRVLREFVGDDEAEGADGDR